MDPRGGSSPVLNYSACQVSRRKMLEHQMLESYSALIWKIMFWNLGLRKITKKDDKGEGGQHQYPEQQVIS